jgi:hypothetical protein
MEKVAIKDLIDFRRKSERSKKTFAAQLKYRKKPEKKDSTGGDYWISCTSAIANVFKTDDSAQIEDKIELLNEKISSSDDKRIKNQFQRNIDLLIGFREFDFQSVKPAGALKILTKPSDWSILTISGFPIQAYPHHVYSYSQNGHEEIGAVWFVARLEGYARSELGMYADMLFRYLDRHYGKDYFVNPQYCVAVDVFKVQEVRYEDIRIGGIPVLIDKTIDEIKRIV